MTLSRNAAPGRPSDWFQSAVMRFWSSLPIETVAPIASFSEACLLTMLMAPVGALRPLSVPAGPFSTSTCSTLNTSREIEPRSRTPSTKMLLELSKPRMKSVSPVVVLPFSPTKKVPTPGLLRRASVRVVAPCWLNRSRVMIWIVCGVSCRDWVNLGEASLSALYWPTAVPSTCTSGNVVGSGLGALSEATCAVAGTASARLVSRVAVVRPFGERSAGVACLRDLIGFMGIQAVLGRDPRGGGRRGGRECAGRAASRRRGRAGSGVRRRVPVGREAAVGPEMDVAVDDGGLPAEWHRMSRRGHRACGGIGLAIRQRLEGGKFGLCRRLPSGLAVLAVFGKGYRGGPGAKPGRVNRFRRRERAGGLREREHHQPGQYPRQQQRRP